MRAGARRQEDALERAQPDLAARLLGRLRGSLAHLVLLLLPDRVRLHVEEVRPQPLDGRGPGALRQQPRQACVQESPGFLDFWRLSGLSGRPTVDERRFLMQF